MTVLTLVLVAVLMILSPIQASAECAWVLWVAELGGQPFPVAGYKSIAECERDKKVWEARDDSGSPPAADTVRPGSAISPATAVASSAFRCLPDTIDARGPKGGRW
jgi:hypothetical protein